MQARVLQNKFKISLQKEENIQEELRSELNEILKGTPDYKLEDQISTIKKSKSFTMDGKNILNFIIITQEWYLRLNTNRFVEKGSKY